MHQLEWGAKTLRQRLRGGPCSLGSDPHVGAALRLDDLIEAGTDASGDIDADEFLALYKLLHQYRMAHLEAFENGDGADDDEDEVLPKLCPFGPWWKRRENKKRVKDVGRRQVKSMNEILYFRFRWFGESE